MPVLDMVVRVVFIFFRFLYSKFKMTHPLRNYVYRLVTTGIRRTIPLSLPGLKVTISSSTTSSSVQTCRCLLVSSDACVQVYVKAFSNRHVETDKKKGTSH